MDSFLIRGILIGLLFGMPAGAVGAMTVQRTLKYGMRAGLLTGLGSSTADCFYACVGACGITFISDFLLKYQVIIHFLGGCLILWMGMGLLRAKNDTAKEITPVTSGVRLFLSSFAVGITNPAAILTFLFAFSWFGISGTNGTTEGLGLVCGVFIGTYIWWGSLSGAVMLLRRKVNSRFQNMNRIFGIVLLLFGILILIRNFLNI